MNTCQHMIVLCARTHQPCPHATYDGSCREAECSGHSLPTFAQMYDVYASVASVSSKRLATVRGILERIASTLGWSMDSRATLGENEWELIYARLSDGTHPLAHEGGYDPATIRLWFDAFRAAAGCKTKAVRTEYRKRGLTPPDCDLIPDVDMSEKSRAIEELSIRQVQIVKDKMTELRLSPFVADRKRFVWMWLALFFGVRPSDICRLTWSCIKRDPYGGWRLEYVPHKTEAKTHGRSCSSAIHPALMDQIEGFVGADDEYVIPRLIRHKPSAVTNGEYVGQHKAIQRWVNRFMRAEVGVTGHMAGYLLRRDCSRYTIKHDGPMVEMQKLGHSFKVLGKHYADLSKIDFGRRGR